MTCECRREEWASAQWEGVVGALSRIRVPGGWLYSEASQEAQVPDTLVFVPHPCGELR